MFVSQVKIQTFSRLKLPLATLSGFAISSKSLSNLTLIHQRYPIMAAVASSNVDNMDTSNLKRSVTDVSNVDAAEGPKTKKRGLFKTRKIQATPVEICKKALDDYSTQEYFMENILPRCTFEPGQVEGEPVLVYTTATGDRIERPNIVFVAEPMFDPKVGPYGNWYDPTDPENMKVRLSEEALKAKRVDVAKAQIEIQMRIGHLLSFSTILGYPVKFPETMKALTRLGSEYEVALGNLQKVLPTGQIESVKLYPLYTRPKKDQNCFLMKLTRALMYVPTQKELETQTRRKTKDAKPAKKILDPQGLFAATKITQKTIVTNDIVFYNRFDEPIPDENRKLIRFQPFAFEGTLASWKQGLGRGVKPSLHKLNIILTEQEMPPTDAMFAGGASSITGQMFTRAKKTDQENEHLVFVVPDNLKGQSADEVFAENKEEHCYLHDEIQLQYEAVYNALRERGYEDEEIEDEMKGWLDVAREIVEDGLNAKSTTPLLSPVASPVAGVQL
jgi:hypothetical protein